MKIYFDANYSKYIAKAIGFLEQTAGVIQTFATDDELYEGASDAEVVNLVSENGGILFTKDIDFKKVQLIIDLMKRHKMGLFYLRTPKKEVYWDTITILFKAYKDIREVILTKNIPYYYEIKPNGKIAKLSL